MRKTLEEVIQTWEPVIGLEIHTEITATRTKMFCGCQIAHGGEPNTRVCPVCLGMPGALPVPNEAAIEWTVLAGLATDCEIERVSQFHRKNYFYPDMPKNYQISQYDRPFCKDGHLTIEVDKEGLAQRLDRDLQAESYETRIGITRIHLEEDTGKMVHVGGSEGRIAGATHSLVDYNRAGTPLMELVSEPDIRTPEEARRFVQKLRLIWLTLGISDGNLENGSMRVDANISLRPRGATELGTRAEVKNMNSFKALHDAVAYEITRQAEVLEEGGRVVQETRHWDAGRKVTSSLRSKEEANDYRYFPEPDMVPFEFSEEFIAGVAARLPELPDARRRRFMSDYGLPASDATILTSDLELCAYYEAAAIGLDAELAKPLANLIVNDLVGALNTRSEELSESQVSPQAAAELVTLCDEGAISGKQAKEVFAEMVETGADPAAIIERKGLKQVSDSAELAGIIDGILAANPDKVEGYRAGKTGLMGFFVGQVMRQTGGQANPQVVNELLGERLGGERLGA
ncbi:MAG: Asp-tRNA(Asn)/Glu-tRNA(Gln) amidotransferase subunit GatB [Actinomycetia bacterium]|nr:Asp-tRNA(Asn)/Glu-tRNA(Gln) amidotransferase subunit GatB [Actinomycetes bacterium]